MYNLAPIALFCYRRLDVLIQTVDALKENELASASDLIIFSDGYKSENDKQGVENVRNYIKTIDGFRTIEIVEAQTNKGLAASIISGVTQVVNKYGKIIVVEDDILTSPYFLNYMNDALNMYENDDKVACISAYTYPIGSIEEQSFFIKGAECWGWATTQQGWANFELDGQKLLNELDKRHLTKEFDFGNSYPFTQMLRDQMAGNNDSWAIRWLASCFLKNKLCLYLGNSLVNNIGFGVADATHCSEQTSVYNVAIYNRKVDLSKIPIVENKEVRKRFAKYFKKMFNTEKNCWFFTKEKRGNKRIITILGFIKISYKKKVN